MSPVESVSPASPSAVLPRRDEEGRARLRSAGSVVAPVSGAHERTLHVGGALGSLLPGGCLRRGTVIHLAGETHSALQLALLAAATRSGEWAAVVEPGERAADFAGLAALEAGVDLERCALVRGVSRERWAVVVGALLEGMAMVIAPVPAYARAADVRRLVARVRERRSVLIVSGAWPGDVALRLTAGQVVWHGLEPGEGLLRGCDRQIVVADKGAPRGARVDLLAHAG